DPDGMIAQGVGQQAAGLGGWAYDKVYNAGALLSGIGSEVIGTGLDILGDVVGTHGLGASFDQAAQDFYKNQSPAAGSGFYDPSHPVTQLGDFYLGALLG